jgi:hexosaminidase
MEKPALVPWPTSVTILSGRYVVPADAIIEGSSPDGDEAALRVARTLAADLQRLGFEPTVRRVTEGARSVPVELRIEADAALGEEGYRLRVGDGVRVDASTERGLFWGTRTVLQLVEGGPGSAVPFLDIADAPQYEYRAVMVDVARQFHSIEFHREMIRKVARYKLNVYHIHFTDDQSWTLPSDEFPDLPTKGRHYTRDQLRELVELAAKYHVTIVPEIDLPGHASTLCAAVPDVVCAGKKPSNVVCAGSEASYATIETILGEAIELFPGPYFHIGADEVNVGVWDGCPECAAAVEQAGYDDYTSLYNHFINRVHAFVKGKGKTMIVWEGFDPSRKPPVDADVIVEQWWNGHVRPEANLEAGHTLINASWAPLYLVQSTVNPPEIIAQWHPRLFGAGVTMQPVDSMIKLDAEAPMLGACMCSWENSEASEPSLFVGEGEQLEGYAVPAPRLQAFAERAWCGDRTDADDLIARIKRLDKVEWPAPVYAADGTMLLPVREPVQVTGGKAITSWPTYGANAPERAFDDNDDTFFWSARPAQVGDTFTLVLDEARPIEHVHVTAAQPERPDDYVHKGVIEISADGKTFAKVAEITGAEADVKLDGSNINAIRIRVTAGQAWWVAIREFVVD